MRALLLALAVLALSPAGAGRERMELQEEGKAPAVDLYPCRASATVVRFFHVEIDAPDLSKVNPALEELGATLVHGPRSSGGRPGHCFCAVRAPREVSAKKLAAALKKGGGAVETLEVLAFDGRTGSDSDLGLGGLGVTKRDLVMGISNDVVWYEASGAWSQFYGRPGKLDAKELAERYAKLYAPYGGAKLGAVVEERVSWPLKAAPEAKVAAKLAKEIEKQPGVAHAGFEGARLDVAVVLAGLEACGDVGALQAGEPLEASDAGTPRAAFDAGAVHALLVEAALVP